MTALKTTVRNRRIDLPAPDNLPDGTDVFLDVTPVSGQTMPTDLIWDRVNASRLNLANSGRSFGDSAELLREDRER